jgi:hypothetical protein
MTDTLPRADDHVRETADEPVLIWAVEEEILLADDAGLLLIARAQGEDALVPTRATLPRALNRLAGAGGPGRRAVACSRPTPGGPAARGGGWRAALRRLGAWTRAALARLRG